MPIVDKFSIRWILEPLAHRDIGQKPYRRAAEIRSLVEAWLPKAVGHGEPFFLFVNFMDPHDPYRAPGEFRDFFPGRRRDWPRERSPHAHFQGATPDEVRRHVFSQYDSELAYLDSELAHLLDYLAASSLLDRSIVVITSDHGEQFLEHALWGHGQSLYQEEVHVPLIIRDPASGPAVIHHPVEQRDLVPWILQRTGVPRPAEIQPSNLLTGRGLKVAELRRSARGHQILVRRAHWAFLHSEQQGDELFDLSSDPGERKDIAPVLPEVAKELRHEMTIWASQWPDTPTSGVRMDAGTVRALRALGYIE
jgi:arylsulfatase A-like enzyme